MSTAEKVRGSPSSISLRKMAEIHFHLGTSYTKKNKEINKVSGQHVVLFRLAAQEGLTDDTV